MLFIVGSMFYMAFYGDIKGHTGSNIFLVKGCVPRISKKRKTSTTSSTQGKVVRVYVALSQMMWTQYFLTNQGSEINKYILCQDNKSSILLEEKVRESSYSCANHINIRYFDTKYRINSEEVTVENFPTNDMLEGYFTR